MLTECDEAFIAVNNLGRRRGSRPGARWDASLGVELGVQRKKGACGLARFRGERAGVVEQPLRRSNRRGGVCFAMGQSIALLAAKL